MTTRSPRRRIRRSRNVWPFSSRREKRAAASTERLTNRLVDAAYGAGKRAGSMRTFEKWFNGLELQSPSSYLKAGLELSYRHGVRDSEVPESGGRSSAAAGPTSRKPRAIRFKGHTIMPRGEDWVTDLEPDSVFESLAEAKRFVSSSARNPNLLRKKGGPPLKGTARAALGWYDKATGKFYEYTAGLPSKLAHSLLKNPADCTCPVHSRKNNPQMGADRMYEIFHGKKPDTEIVVEEEIHEHEHLATLGRLVEIVVETLTNKELTMGWEDDETAPWLACNEKGNQLFIIGPDQSIPLGKIGMDKPEWLKDSMVIGDLIKTTYRTEKDFDNFEEIDYYHSNGEESGVPPELIYDPISKKMYVSGGKYRIEHDGIID